MIPSPLEGEGREGGITSNTDLARTLRRRPTDAERAIWQRLRRQRIGGHRFRRQHPLGSYVVDFVCLEARLVIEVDGAHHMEQETQDGLRTQWLESRGFRVLRFWDNEVLTELARVEQAIFQELVEGTTPLPNPPPQGGRGSIRSPSSTRDPNTSP